jgi:hypothetical protein
METPNGTSSAQDPFDFDSPPEAPAEVKATGDPVKTEETAVTGKGDEALDLGADPNTTPPPRPTANAKTGLAGRLKKVVKKKEVKAKGKAPSTKTPAAPTAGASPQKRQTVMAKKNGTAAEAESKVGLSLTDEAAKALRKMRAKMELASGDKVSNSDAVLKAVEVALPEIVEA